MCQTVSQHADKSVTRYRPVLGSWAETYGSPRQTSDLVKRPVIKPEAACNSCADTKNDPSEEVITN